MNANQYFCLECDEERISIPKMTNVLHNIKGEEISLEVMLPYCSVCDSQLSDLDIDEKHFDMALDEYRKRKDLLYPHEIKAIRESYGISQRAFARALGFAEPTINRYEQGAIQDVVHNNLILLVGNPDNMIEIALRNKKNLSDKELSIIQENAQCIKSKNSVKQEFFEEILMKCMSEFSSKISSEISNVVVIANNNTHKINELDSKFGAYLKDFKNHCKQTSLPQKNCDWGTILNTRDISFPISTKNNCISAKSSYDLICENAMYNSNQ